MVSHVKKLSVLCLVSTTSFLVACGEASPADDSIGSGGASAGGTPGAGGAVATGGLTAAGGAGGGQGAGGSVSVGGVASVGGTVGSGGAASGGDAAVGGVGTGGEVAAGGASSGGSVGAGGGGAGEFLLSSPAWEGVNNEDCTKDVTEPCPTYPLESTNFGSPEKNVSPEMSWSGVPEGTLSFAVVLSDLTNGSAHWALYDIPADVSMLPRGLPKTSPLTDPAGAIQVTNFGQTGYFGSGACGNVYEHRVYALGVANLGATGNVTAIRTAIQGADILGETFIRLQSRDCN